MKRTAPGVNDGIHGNKSYWERYNYLRDELGGKILADILAAGSPKERFNSLDKKEISNLWGVA